MADKHAILSASASHRWLACTPSARLEEQFPASESEYAAAGTEAHKLCEIRTSYKMGAIKPEDYVKELDEFTASAKYYDEEMRECADAYVELVTNKLEGAAALCDDAFMELEVKVDFSKYVKKGFGTSDCVIVSDDVLEIIDFKYGKGVLVEAENNTQMMLYALGAYEKYKSLYDINGIRMTIFQPRLRKEPSEWEISIGELLDWGKNYVKPRAQLAYNGQGDFAPSEETCRFCKAKAQCAARMNENLKVFNESPDPLIATVEEVAEVLKKAKDIRAWLSDMEDFVTSKLFEGQTVPGWKLVEGRSNRKIADEEKAVERFVAAGIAEPLLYETKLISLTQMEKDFGKKHVAEILGDLLVKPQGKPTLAPESDKRPAMALEDQVLKAFDDEGR